MKTLLAAGEELTVKLCRSEVCIACFAARPSVAFEPCNADHNNDGWKQLAARRSQWRKPSLETGSSCSPEP